MPVKSFTAAFPVATSLVLLGMVLGRAALFGAVHDTDEGTAAHIFQLFMPLDLAVMVWFALEWLPKQRREALQVVAIQVAAAAAVFAGVYFLT